jgi:hypothetical protein
MISFLFLNYYLQNPLRLLTVPQQSYPRINPSATLYSRISLYNLINYHFYLIPRRPPLLMNSIIHPFSFFVKVLLDYNLNL